VHRRLGRTAVDSSRGPDAEGVAAQAGSDGVAPGLPAAGPGPAWTSERLARWVFVAYLTVAFVVLVKIGSNYWFNGDDDFGLLVGRQVGSLDDLLRPQHGHWSTVPLLVFHSLYQLVGLRYYFPYQVIVIVLHLVVATLVRVVMRRAGVGPWVATLVASVLVLFGLGGENVFLAIQISMMGSMVLGFTQLLLADHDGGIDRRDWIGLGAGAVSLMCSGIGPILIFAVGLSTLMRRGWRMAAFHVAPLGLMFAAWYIHYRSSITADSGPAPPGAILEWVAAGETGVLDAMGHFVVISLALALLLVGGLALAWLPLTPSSFRKRAAGPVGLLLAGVVLFVAIASERWFQGSDWARSSRYVDMGLALALPAFGVATDAIVRRWRYAAPPIVALYLVVIGANAGQYGDNMFPAAFFGRIQFALVGSAYSPLAERAPRDLVPAPNLYAAPNVTMGFLLDAKRDGKLPDPPPLGPVEQAGLVTTLTIRQGLDPPGVHQRQCLDVAVPLPVKLKAGDVIRIRGPLSVTPKIDGQPVGATTYQPTDGPALRIQISDVDLFTTPIGPNPSYQICPAS
jgi:hypothetical protein